MACDLCGKVKVGVEELKLSYQTDEVKMICDECEKIVDKELTKISKWTDRMRSALLSRYFNQKKESFTS